MRHAKAGIRGAASGVLTALLLAGAPAAALEFASEQLIYSEIIDAETAYPTTPELDEIGAGGLVQFFQASQEPTLTGSAARVTLTFPSEQGGHQIDASGIGTASFGFSGIFGNLALPIDATVATSIGAFFDTPGQITVSANLVIPPESSSEETYLYLLEFDLAPVDPILEQSFLFLPDVVTSALRSGSSHVVRLFVDREAGTARASVEVPVLGIFEGDPLSLVGLEGVALDLLAQGAALGQSLPATPATVDLKPFAVYSGVAEFAPLFNVDVGAIAGTPSGGYAAAGSAGAWNTIGLGTTALTTVGSGPSPVTATLMTDSDLGFGPGSPPDAQALMGDYGVDCGSDFWSLSFANLPNGVYRIFIYAPSAPGASTGDMVVLQAGTLADLPGDDGAALLPGVSYVRTTATVSDGSLDLSGQGSGAIACAGIAGLQLERQLAPGQVAGVPALSLGSQLLLGLGLLGAGYAARRRLALPLTGPDPASGAQDESNRL